MLRLVFGTVFLFSAIVWILWESAPRVISDFRYASEFVPATDLRITSYRCTNWDYAVVHECTVAFASTTGQRVGELKDWGFGRAPTDRIRLLQRRSDAAMVTTDLSLSSLWNRIAVVAAVVAFGVLCVLGIVLRIRRSRVAPANPPVAT
jgi:hypothetical protein